MKKEVDMEKFWGDAELRHSKLKEIVKQIELKTGVQIPIKEFDRKRIEEDVEYVKAKTKEIEERIIATTEELFESEKERELLHISIRVSCDFHKFLLDFGDEPPSMKPSMSGTRFAPGWTGSIGSPFTAMESETIL